MYEPEFGRTQLVAGSKEKQAPPVLIEVTRPPTRYQSCSLIHGAENNLGLYGTRVIPYVAQPVAGIVAVLKNLELERQAGCPPGGKNVVMCVGLYDVGDVAQAQPAGLRHPDLQEPTQAFEPWALQLRVVVEQIRAGGVSGIAQVGLGPLHRLGRVDIAAPGSLQPAFGFFVAKGAGTVVSGVNIQVEEHAVERIALGEDATERVKLRPKKGPIIQLRLLHAQRQQWLTLGPLPYALVA
jgi:hypothetical protein